MYICTHHHSHGPLNVPSLFLAVAPLSLSEPVVGHLLAWNTFTVRLVRAPEALAVTQLQPPSTTWGGCLSVEASIRRRDPLGKYCRKSPPSRGRGWPSRSQVTLKGVSLAPRLQSSKRGKPGSITTWLGPAPQLSSTETGLSTWDKAEQND